MEFTIWSFSHSFLCKTLPISFDDLLTKNCDCLIAYLVYQRVLGLVRSMNKPLLGIPIKH